MNVSFQPNTHLRKWLLNINPNIWWWIFFMWCLKELNKSNWKHSFIYRLIFCYKILILKLINSFYMRKFIVHLQIWSSNLQLENYQLLNRAKNKQEPQIKYWCLNIKKIHKKDMNKCQYSFLNLIDNIKYRITKMNE
jgi:hypothetical protein